MSIYTQYLFSSVQLLSLLWLFATPWIAACQASLSITSSQSSLRFASIESVMPSSHLILCRPLLLLPPSLPASKYFPMSQLFTWGGQSTRVSALVKYKFVFLVCPLIMSSFWSASYQLLLDHASFHLFTRVMMQPSSWAGESRSSDVFLWLSCICIVSISCSFLVLALSTSTYSFTAEICIKHVSILCMNLTEARWGLPWQFSG